MSRERNNGSSMQSEYLYEFRKRKNQLIASEIDPFLDDLPVGEGLPGDSAFLEAFRYRKSQRLGEELNVIQQEMGETFTGVERSGETDAPENEPVFNPVIELRKNKGSGKYIAVLLLFAATLGAIYFISGKKKSDEITGDPDAVISFVSVSGSDTPETVESDGSGTTSADVSSAGSAEKTTATTSLRVSSDEASSEDPSGLKELNPGDNNEDVRKMQLRLAELGYLPQSSCTGFYGDYTQKRLKQFQKKAGLKQTGIADVQTLRRLYADDAPKR